MIRTAPARVLAAAAVVAAGLTAVSTTPVGAAGPAPAPASVAPASAPAVTTLVDDTGLLQIDVPAEWADTSTAPEHYDDGTPIPAIGASTDLAAFWADYLVPGVAYQALATLDDEHAAITEVYDFSDACTDGGVDDYYDGYFVGAQQTWTGCAGTTTEILTIVATTLDQGFTASVLLQIPTPADRAGADVVLGSFYVTEPTTTTYTDDTGTITIALPASWTVDTRPVRNDDGSTSPAIHGATDPSEVGGPVFVPSVQFIAEAYDPDAAAVLATRRYDGRCTEESPSDYDDGQFVGLTQRWVSCDGGEAMIVSLVANPPDGTFTAVLEIVVPTEADLNLLDIVLYSFNGAG